MADKDMPLPFSTAIMAHLALDAASVLLLLTSLSMGTPVTLTVWRCTLKRRRIGLRRMDQSLPIILFMVSAAVMEPRSALRVAGIAFSRLTISLCLFLA